MQAGCWCWLLVLPRLSSGAVQPVQVRSTARAGSQLALGTVGTLSVGGTSRIWSPARRSVDRSIGPIDNQPLLEVPSTPTYAADGDEDDDDNSLCPQMSHHRDCNSTLRVQDQESRE